MTALRPADSPSLLRRINSSVVLDAVRSGGPMSRAELSRATGLSKPTITQVAERLLDSGWVEEVAPSEGPRRPGRKAPLLSFRADLGYVLGVDIGANKVLALVSDLSGSIVGRADQSLGKSPKRRGVLTAARRTMAAALADAGLDEGDIRALAIGTPGVIDPVTGEVSLAPQIAGWDGTRLGEEFSDDFGCPLLVDNESSLSLLAESWRGAARGYQHVAFVQVGIGIGGALLIHGKVFGGRSGSAGEIGYLVDGDAPEDVPPHVGAFEWRAGGRAYQRLGAEAARKPSGKRLLALAGGDPENVTAEIVFDAARAGDRAAAAVVDELTGRLGRGVANMASVLDPELVLIGGGLSAAGASLLDPVARAVHALTAGSPHVALSELGGEATALGAVKLALGKADSLIFNAASGS